MLKIKNSIAVMLLAVLMCMPSLTLVSCDNNPVTTATALTVNTEGLMLETDSPSDWTIPEGLRVFLSYSDNTTKEIYAGEYTLDYTALREAKANGVYKVIVKTSLADLTTTIDVTVNKTGDILKVDASAVDLTTDDPKNWKVPEGLVVTYVDPFEIETVLTADQYTINYDNLRNATDNGTFTITVTSNEHGCSVALIVTVEGWEPNGKLVSLSIDTSEIKTLVSTVKAQTWTPEGLKVTGTYELNEYTKELGFEELYAMGAIVTGYDEIRNVDQSITEDVTQTVTISVQNSADEIVSDSFDMRITQAYVDLSYYFQNKYPDTYSTLTEIPAEDLEYLNCGLAATAINHMFYGCSSMETAPYLDIDTSNCSDFTRMFSGVTEDMSLSSIDTSWIDTSSAINLYAMFYKCTNITSIDLSGFDVSKVQNFGGMFGLCRTLKDLNISGWSNNVATSVAIMFSGCYALEEIDMTWLDSTCLTNLNNAFLNCSALVNIDISNWDTSNGTNFSSMFNGCSVLKGINGVIDLSSATNVSSMFRGVSSAAQIKVKNIPESLTTDFATTTGGTEGRQYVIVADDGTLESLELSQTSVNVFIDDISDWTYDGTVTAIYDVNGVKKN